MLIVYIRSRFFPRKSFAKSLDFFAEEKGELEIPKFPLKLVFKLMV